MQNIKYINKTYMIYKINNIDVQHIRYKRYIRYKSNIL